ncbi:hypothetical protein Tco_1162748 [Tanacetum coccineum]
MTGIYYTSPSGDGLCGGHLFDVMPLRDSIVTADGNELSRVSVQNVNVGTDGRRLCVTGYVGSSSTIAPLNHAYLCLNVTDGVIRPEIVPFTNTSLGTTYEGDGHRENTHHTGGLFQHNEVFPTTPMSDTSSMGTRSMRQSSIKGSAAATAWSIKRLSTELDTQGVFNAATSPTPHGGGCGAFTRRHDRHH